ncbi:unnamed protein product [Phytophthora fragariaefolia]|uniref:Unnamed protein product n=1 Tax=Phytophthora fragariaefolia TaxID=1490495 RepID=A0A9W6WJS5_9STRA|nr:unnamed protein product [Phytophthora fragariaefolia]
MKEVRNDNAKELTKLSAICTKKYDMECTSSVKHTPEQNGVAERMIRTITERMRCLLSHFQLPEEMWGEAAVTTTYCINIIPNSIRDMEIPYAVRYRELPVYSRLRTFGCAVLAYVDKVERRKMQPKAREAIFVGYSREKRGYRLLDSKTRKAFYSHTAVFYERKAGRNATGVTPSFDTTVPIERYLELNNVAMDNIPTLLDEMHHEDADNVVMIAAGQTCQVGQTVEVPGLVGQAGLVVQLPGLVGQMVLLLQDTADSDTASASARAKRGRTERVEWGETPQKRTRSGNVAAVRGAVPREDMERPTMRNVCEIEQNQKFKRNKKKRCRGRRMAPTAEATLQQEKSRQEPPIRKQTPSLETCEIETVGSETPVHRVGPSTESIQTSSCRGLREYTASGGAHSKYCPVTRSGRVSKPPSWIGDYIFDAYANTNSDEFMCCSVSWEKSREEMQHAIAKEQALAWWQDFCCLTMGVIDEPETYAKAIESEFAVQWKAAAQAEYDALMKFHGRKI